MNTAITAAPGQQTSAVRARNLDENAATLREPLTVVICAYTMRRWGDLCSAVDSVQGQLREHDECILIIDHNDELHEQATAAFSGVRISANKDVRGLSGARNTGVDLAVNDIVVFLDDDAVAMPDLTDAVAGAMADPAVVAVGGSPEPAWPGGRRPWWFAEEFDWVVGCSYRGLPTKRAQVRNVIGAAMAFRRSVLTEVGPFSTAVGRVGTLPMGCEETELCIRVRQHRPTAVIYHLPDARVSHRVTPERTTWRYFLRRCYGEGISKALIAEMVGKQDALASERSYVTRVLPRAFLRNLVLMGRGQLSAGGKSVAVVLGLALTLLGYGKTRVARFRRTRIAASGSASQDFSPILIADADIEQDWVSLPSRSPSGAPYGGAELLVRDGMTPVELVGVPAERLGTTVALGELLSIPAGARRDGRSSGSPVGISVVVATHSRPQRAAACVRSILATGWPRVEVIIVDNNPGNTVDSARLRELAAADSRLRYVPAPERGASAARNKGMRAASNDIVAFTDDDVVVDRHWLNAIAEAFADPTVSCVTGLIRPQRLDTPAQLWFERYGGFGKGLRPRRFDRDRPDDGAGALYPFAAGMFGSGNNVAFRRSTLLELGGYNPLLGPGIETQAGEDLDLFIRVILAGNVLSYDPRVLVYHDHRSDPKQLQRQLYSYGCGLTAMLFAQACRDPMALLAIIRRIPQGVRLMVDPSSAKNRERGRGYPKRLVFAEWRGMALGPILYLVSHAKKTVHRG